MPTNCVRCRFEAACIPYQTYKKINPSSQLTIDGKCVDGCTANALSYAYMLYFTYDSNLTVNTAWQSLNKTAGLVTGIMT